MSELLMKLVNGVSVTDEDIAYELNEICDRVHSGCDAGCPVFEKNGGPLSSNGESCDCFKDGKAMLAFLRADKECQDEWHDNNAGGSCPSCGMEV